LFIIWFGIDEPAKLAVITAATIFPMYLNTYAGVRVSIRSPWKPQQFLACRIVRRHRASSCRRSKWLAGGRRRGADLDVR
jgi:hypothetical protein